MLLQDADEEEDEEDEEDEDENLPPPANLDDFSVCNAMPRGECVICLEPFVPGAHVRTLSCMHVYHHQCIEQWLGLKRFCPICKTACL